MSRASRRPPRAALRLLRRVLPGEEFRERSGDLEEVYSSLADKRGNRLAGIWYRWQVAGLIPAYLWNEGVWRLVMFGNQIKIAFRSLKKQRGTAVLNVLGLSVGIAGSLLITLYVRNELSFDRHNLYAERIHRLAAHMAMAGRESKVAVSSAPMAQTLVNELPEVENAVRFKESGSLIFTTGDRGFREYGLAFADPSLFEIFTIPLLEGDPRTALVDPFSLVLSSKTAEKYFGRENPLGRTLTTGEGVAYKVTGVFDRLPDAGHFHFDIFASLASLDSSRSPNWIEMGFQTYLLLGEGVDPAAVEAKFPAFLQRFIAPGLKEMMGKSMEELETEMGLKFRFFLQPLTGIHLHSDLQGEFEPNGDYKTILIFTPIALFILIIAGINYMNLATARSSGRAREVGLRKVMGSRRQNLIHQFLLESLILSGISLAAGLLLSGLCLPVFNHMAGISLSWPALFEGPMPLVLGGIMVLIGLLGGSYPAFFLSSFQPSRVLRGRLGAGIKAGPLRNGLVIFQFTASVFLLIGTLVVFRQISFIRSKPIGFDRDQVLVLNNVSLLGDSAESFKTEMLRHPSVISATLSGHLPVPSSRTAYPVIPEGESSATQPLPMAVWNVDHDYIETLGMRLAEGRNFLRERASDDEAAILNQSAVLHFGLTEPLGRRLNLMSDPSHTQGSFTVIGVVEDFHYESLRETIQPLMLTLGRSTAHLSFRINTGNIPDTIAAFQKQWKSFLPYEPFSYSFLDDRFEAMYRTELRMGNLLGVFSALAVLIGCLGLFGLAAFTAENRTKEIGIRKVLGAGIPDILGLLVKEFMILVGIANLVAWPIAYFAMHRWLQDFAYRAPLALWILPAAGALTAVIALATVGWHAGRAAGFDPVRTLRYE